MRNSLFRRIILICCIPAGMMLLVSPTIGIEPLTSWHQTNPVIFITAGLAAVFISAFLVSQNYRNAIQKISARIKNIAPPDEKKSTSNTGMRMPQELRELDNLLEKKFTTLQSEQTTLISEKKMFDSTLKNMNDGIFIVDKNQIVTLINPSACRIFGIQRKDVIGHTMAEALRNFRINELYDQCRDSKQQEQMSIEIAPHKAFIQCIATPLDPELPENILFLLQDLTRIRQLEIVRRDFVSNVSHELRTPLASLKLIAETLQGGALNDPPAAKRFLERMDNEVDNLSQMVEELLELSRIESGKVPLEKRWINPQDLINRAMERMQLQAERAGLTLSMTTKEQLPNILVDAPRLEQVLVNLLHNAIKFTNPGGKVEIRSERKLSNILFHISDTGVGIPPKDLERIFERFYKTDRSRTERGTGLGLSISRHLVEAHQGTIWAESQPGTGSTFSFSIPLNK